MNFGLTSFFRGFSQLTPSFFSYAPIGLFDGLKRSEEKKFRFLSLISLERCPCSLLPFLFSCHLDLFAFRRRVEEKLKIDRDDNRFLPSFLSFN